MERHPGLLEVSGFRVIFPETLPLLSMLPKPYTLNPKPQTLNPRPLTPKTPNPTTLTSINPTLEARGLGSGFFLLKAVRL